MANWQRRTFLSFLLLLVSLVSGCVRYDVGIDFAAQQSGEIVQHITLSDRLTALSQSEAEQWLQSVVFRAKQLAGTAKKLSNQEVVVTIPFNNGQDLVKKFNQFYHPQSEQGVQATAENLDVLQLEANIDLEQSNWLLFERNHLTLEVDLRGLGVLSQQGNIIVSPGSLFNINLSLNTPWGSRLVDGENPLNPLTRQSGSTLLWQLQSGQINHLEAVFWVPSYLGWGTIAIILLMLLGFIVKYGYFPGIAS